MLKRYIPVFLAIILVTSCRFFDSGNSVRGEFDIPDDLLDDSPLEIAAEVIDGMIQNISSPVETAAIIKGLKVPFNRDYLAPTRYADGFNTNFQMALGLGIYGADLGYLNMYEQTTLVINYIATIRNLSNGIQVGQFFDFATLRRIATNKENLDSLMLISQQSFNRIDSYLRETNRSSLSVLIVAGVWIEGLYISTRVAQDANHPRINETIGEQKVIMNDLMLLLRNYHRDPNIANLISDFEEIEELFENVRITYEYRPSTPIEKNGVLTFQQNDVQHIDMSDELLKEIIKKVQEIRNRIVKG